MKDIYELGIEIVKGACTVEAKGIGMELAEAGLDSLLKEGVLKEIPVLGSIVAVGKSLAAIHDRLFIRKVAAFLQACPRFDEGEQAAFLQEHLGEASKARKLGESLVLLLDRLDDMEKPEMLARSFAALVRRKFRLETFRRLAQAIDIGFVEDLRGLANEPKQAEGVTEVYLPSLLRTGLVFLAPSQTDYSGAAEPKFIISDLGRMFIDAMNG